MDVWTKIGVHEFSVLFLHGLSNIGGKVNAQPPPLRPERAALERDRVVAAKLVSDPCSGIVALG